MITNEREARQETVEQAARLIMAAARTAPKGKGIDVVEIGMVTQPEISLLAEQMRIIGEEIDQKFYLRDADNIMQAEALILIGTHEQAQGLNCKRCGFDTCAGRPEGVPCAINTIDVGIAMGSACAAAADLRIDSRVMHSVGMAAMRLGFPQSGLNNVLGLALSCKSKNPFFDRKPKEETK